MNGPYSAELWDESESWPRDRIHAFQVGELATQLAYVWERSDFYRRRLGETGWEPGDIGPEVDLSKLPFTR